VKVDKTYFHMLGGFESTYHLELNPNESPDNRFSSAHLGCGGEARTHLSQRMRLGWNYLQSTPRHFLITLFIKITSIFDTVN
jgi:hypothetical protein